MISIEDVIGLCELTEAEIEAVAEHEHIPTIAAAALAEYLLHESHGPERIREMIRDDMRAALADGNREHAKELFMALRHFVTEHPDAGWTGAA